jgi:cytochrome b6-f complex iron-sulfur subunit
MWVTEYPVDKIDRARTVYPAPVLTGMEAGLVALWQTCPHLGCRVPECKSSQWFECPCHGSRYNRVGERRGGPAPRGMDLFGMEVDGRGNFVVNTGALFQGSPIGTNTTGQEAEGPSCIGQGSGGH